MAALIYNVRRKCGDSMIELTKINNEPIVINSCHIECVEKIPESKVIMDTGRYYVVREKVEEIIQKTIEYNGRIREFEEMIRSSANCS